MLNHITVFLIKLVLVTEWPLLGKQLLTTFTIHSLCLSYKLSFRTLVLTASVPDH